MDASPSNGAAMPDCCICMAPLLGTGPESVVTLCCGHLFHKDCLATWFTQANANGTGIPKYSCPMCRQKLKFQHNFTSSFPWIPLIIPQSSNSESKERVDLQTRFDDLLTDSTQMQKELNKCKNELNHFYDKTAEFDKVSADLTRMKEKLEKFRHDASRVPELSKQNEKLKQDHTKLKHCKLVMEQIKLSESEDTNTAVQKLISVKLGSEPLTDGAMSLLRHIYSQLQSSKQARRGLESSLKQMQETAKQETQNLKQEVMDLEGQLADLSKRGHVSNLEANKEDVTIPSAVTTSGTGATLSKSRLLGRHVSATASLFPQHTAVISSKRLKSGGGFDDDELDLDAQLQSCELAGPAGLSRKNPSSRLRPAGKKPTGSKLRTSLTHKQAVASVGSADAENCEGPPAKKKNSKMTDVEVIDLQMMDDDWSPLILKKRKL